MILKVVKLRQVQQNSPETSRTDNNIYIWLKKKKKKNNYTDAFPPECLYCHFFSWFLTVGYISNQLT